MHYDRKELKRALKDAATFCGDTPGLNVRIRTTYEGLLVSSTDRYALAQFRVRRVGDRTQDFDAAISRTHAKSLAQILGAQAAPVEIRRGNWELVFEGAGAVPLEEPATLQRVEERLSKLDRIERSAPNRIGLTVDVIRRLPRQSGAESKALAYYVGPHTVWYDPDGRWRLFVMPLSKCDDPAAEFEQINEPWRGCDDRKSRKDSTDD